MARATLTSPLLPLLVCLPKQTRFSMLLGSLWCLQLVRCFGWTPLLSTPSLCQSCTRLQSGAGHVPDTSASLYAWCTDPFRCLMVHHAVHPQRIESLPCGRTPSVACGSMLCIWSLIVLPCVSDLFHDVLHAVRIVPALSVGFIGIPFGIYS